MSSISVFRGSPICFLGKSHPVSFYDNSYLLAKSMHKAAFDIDESTMMNRKQDDELRVPNYLS
jgi:hypothetical protein